jgi:predicted transcriptional regulator
MTMAMGIVSDDDFDLEKSKICPPSFIDPTSHDAVIIDLEKGRGNNPEVPNSLRKVIGDESVTSGRQSALELANNFGISPSSVSSYSQGAHSTASYNDRPDMGHINEAKLRVAKKARNRLVMALNSLTQEKIESAKVKDIAGVAKDMSAIIRNMEPEKVNNVGPGGPTFIFYSPQLRSEKVFDVVHVKE